MDAASRLGTGESTLIPPSGSPARPSGLQGLVTQYPGNEPQNPRWFEFWKHNFCIRENVNFGTWDGVFPAVLAHLLNVIVFLRTGWIVGDAGILYSLLISLCLWTFAAITVMSAYGILMRSGRESCQDVYQILQVTLGTRAAASIGVIYSFTHAASSALQVLGMGELIIGASFDMIDHVWAIRLTAVCCLIVLTWLNVFGIKWIIRAQYVIVIFLALGIGDFFVGSLYQEIPEYGIERPSAEIFKENLYPQYDNWHGFWKNMGIFFPSVAGVLVGFNIARDLRDPQRSIPKGTFAAMLCSMSVHIMFILMLGACVLRSYLVEHPHITIRMAALHVFIIITIFISSFAVGLGAIFNASRVLARVAKDTSIRGVKQLDWMWDRFQTPLYSILVVFLTSLIFVLIGHINFLAPIITTSHLMTFSAINYAYFALSTTYKLQVKRDYKATTEWLQQGLREGRIASPESRHQSPKFPRSPEQHGTMSHSSSVTSERSHLLGSGSAGHTPREPFLPPLKVASPVLSKPGDTLLKFHNRWVALAASIIMVVIAFLIQWESALSTISTLGLIYISVSYLTPRPTAGIVEFRPVDWIVSKFTGETYADLESETLQEVSTAGAPEESRFIRSLGSPHLPTSSFAPFLSG